ncbi:MAG: dihydrodipicolinate synthase family protein [Armatimonadetes bacterium]|nr:dihydrodipicolinate synthase family protein [Armatimonadota bacterium]
MTPVQMGVYTALVTPFDDAGDLDLSLVPALVDFQRAARVDGLVVAGTNGEGVSMSVSERMRLLEAVMAEARDLSIIAGTGAASVRDAAELSCHASALGCDAVLVLPPFFFRNADPAGLALYYREVSAASSVPLILYSIPQFSGVPIGAEVLDLLRHDPRVIGVKESSGDLGASLRLLAQFPSIRLYIGSDDLASELFSAGAVGVISGTANAFPELLVGVRDAVRSGTGIAEAQDRLNAAIRINIRYPIVANMKRVLEARGIARMGVRPPLLPLDSAASDEMLRLLREVGALES